MENKKGSNFGNGFLLGALVGGAIVFAVGTKKGRRILKALTEEGIEGVSEINDLIQDYQEVGEEFEEEDEPVVVSPKAENKTSVKHEAVVEAEMVEEPHEQPSPVQHAEKPRSAAHRFFRRKK